MYIVQLSARINENVDDGDMDGDMITFDDYDGSDDEIDDVSTEIPQIVYIFISHWLKWYVATESESYSNNYGYIINR